MHTVVLLSIVVLSPDLQLLVLISVAAAMGKSLNLSVFHCVHLLNEGRGKGLPQKHYFFIFVL